MLDVSDAIVKLVGKLSGAIKIRENIRELLYENAGSKKISFLGDHCVG